MEIKRQTYEALAPRQRAVAAYAAVARRDDEEASRLLGRAPRGTGHGWPFLVIGQALDAFNMMAAVYVREFLVVTGEIKAADAFCEGWEAAGGSAEDSRCQGRRQVADALTIRASGLAQDVNSVRQAAREWCKENELPESIFAESLAFIPLGEVTDEVSPETLETMRELFNAITL